MAHKTERTEPTTTAAVPPAPSSRTGHRLSPERRAAGELASTLLDRSLQACCVSQAQAASALGVCSERVGDWADPEHEAAFTVRDVLVLARRMPTLGAELLRQLGESASQRKGPGLSPLQHVARVTSEVGDVARTVAEAMLDGAIDVREADAIDTEIVQAIAALEAARRDLRQR